MSSRYSSFSPPLPLVCGSGFDPSDSTSTEEDNIHVFDPKSPFQSFSMMCAPLHVDSVATQSLSRSHIPGALQRGSPQASLLERRDLRRTLSLRRPGPNQILRPSLQTTNTDPSSLPPRQSHWERPQQLLQSQVSRLPQHVQFEEVSFQYEPWGEDVEWRRPASASTVPPQSDRYRDAFQNDRSYQPGDHYSLPGREHRSLSQPGVRTGRGHAMERPSLLRQTTEATAMRQQQHQFWDEPAFRGNADYQLFVEATFGLSPERPSRSRSPSSASSEAEQHFEQALGFGEPDEGTLCPEDSVTYRASSYSSPRFTFDIDNSRSQRARGSAESSRAEPFVESSLDEELPNYAQSQAQMEQRMRMEAVRRAQELQRRWREAH